MRYRVALVVSHVIQYQDPFFRLLAAEPSIDLTVLFCSRAGAEPYRDVEMQTDLQWDVQLLEGYNHRFLHNLGFGSGYARSINPGIAGELLSGRFDAAIFFTGWGTITSLLGIAACRMKRLPFFLYGDSSFPPAATSAHGHVRAGFLRTIFGMAAGFLVSGKLNADYYAHYGADSSRFFLVPWAVDNQRFASSGRLSPAERSDLRRKVGASDEDVLFVFSGKLLPRKDPMTLLRALSLMRNRRRAAGLILGNGELREELQAFARDTGLRVHFAGFVNQAELPRYYAAADVFVLPSTHEPRGAVINEAMACGLPIVVTDRCGSIGDIVLEGENAMIYPAGNAAALAARLDQVTDDESLRQGMGRRSLEIIDTWDYARGVRGVVKAIESIAIHGTS